MKYNRLEKHKITYLKDNIIKKDLLKELESQIKYRLNFSTSNRTNYLTCTKIDISEIFTI